MTGRIAWISLTPVKATRLHVVEEVELTEAGVHGDRRFFLVDENGRRVNCKDHGPLQLIHADYDETADFLTLHFPDGDVAEGAVERGGEIETTLSGRPRLARPLVGPWSDAITTYAGRSLRVVEPALPAQDRGRSGAATLLATSSLDALAGQLGVAAVDPRRFRMNFVVDGLDPHEEDRWHGRRVRVGDAVVIPQGNVGRCAITTQDPDRGVADLDTLKALAAYRGEVETTEPLPFGIHAAVAQAGRVRVGDPVEAL